MSKEYPLNYRQQNNQLVTYDTAIKAFEKGYKISDFYFLFGDFIDSNNKPYGSLIMKIDEWKSFIPDNMIHTPTQSALQKWLREEHNIHINLICLPDYKYKWCLIEIGDVFNITSENTYNSYEAALEQGLWNGIRLID